MQTGWGDDALRGEGMGEHFVLYCTPVYQYSVQRCTVLYFLKVQSTQYFHVREGTGREVDRESGGRGQLLTFL